MAAWRYSLRSVGLTTDVATVRSYQFRWSMMYAGATGSATLHRWLTISMQPRFETTHLILRYGQRATDRPPIVQCFRTSRGLCLCRFGPLTGLSKFANSGAKESGPPQTPKVTAEFSIGAATTETLARVLLLSPPPLPEVAVVSGFRSKDVSAFRSKYV
jgi:hypothetical protein